MLARWFDRSGIGQLLAPDPDAAPVSENDESRSQIWQYLAPDENFAQPKAPPSEIFPPRFHSSESSSSGRSATKSPRTPWTPASNTTAATTPAALNHEDDLNSRVLSACRDTTMYMRSPMPERKVHDKFLRICASIKVMPQKTMDRMRSMVENDNYGNAHLLRVRATRMGESAPDGYTAFMVAAYANHVNAAKLILEMAENYAEASGDTTTYANLHLDRDMSGMTALHIAGERGHVEMIQYLLPLYNFPLPPAETSTTMKTVPKKPAFLDGGAKTLVPLIDLAGQTAFGRAVTSPVPKAKRNQRTLEKSLFSNNDLSIFGEIKPIESRMGTINGLKLEYGTSDMPGLRGYMEDAMSVKTWFQGGSSGSGDNNGEMALFTVCDGHGDNGKVSDFIASNVENVLKDSIDEQERKNLVPSEEYWSEVWNKTCLKLDRKLKEARLTEGGSTGVFALVTEREIIVANVGDSRCILARKETTGTNTGGTEHDTSTGESTDETPDESAKTADAATGAAEPSGAPPELTEEQPTTTERAVIVTALSEDHKPNLPEETARIRNAGFELKTIEFEEEDGTKTVLHKVAKNDRDQLAVSRAFGDFDYKSNTTLSESEQAVIPLAGVTVHTRSPDDDLYLVLACDGIWDVMENEAVIGLVDKQMGIKAVTSPDSLLPDVADVLLQECLGRESRDNMSAILVSLRPNNRSVAALASPSMPEPKTLDFGS